MTLTEGSPAVIVALNDGTLQQWDVASGQEKPISQPKLEKMPPIGPGGGDDDNVDRAVFSRDGRSVALMGGGCVQVCDVASGDRRFKFEGASIFGAVCEFAPSGGSLVVVKEERERFRAGDWRGSSLRASTILWLDSQSGDIRRELVIPELHVCAAAFSGEGQTIGAGTWLEHPARGVIRIFRLRDKREIQTIEAPCYGIESLCFTPDGNGSSPGFATRRS
jgi:WD40 repeat protein